MEQPGSQPAGRRGLSLDRIVDAAVELARQEGIEGISMRRLAAELDVEAMSLYYYVPSKASLMMLMADRTVSQMPRPDPTLAWHEQLVDLLVETYLAAMKNPVLLPVLASEPHHPRTLPAARGTGGASLFLLERVLELLAQGRLPLEVQLDAFLGLTGVAIGFIAGQVDGLLPAAGATDRPTVVDERRRADTAPLLAAISPALAAADPAQALRFTLQLCVSGLRRLAEPEQDAEHHR